jgi:hypothetical protein
VDNIKIKYDRRLWTGLIWLSMGKVASACKYYDKTFGSLKCVEFLDYVRNCQRFELVSVAWSQAGGPA